MSILPIPQAHAWAVAVRGDEYDAGGFQGGPDGGDGAGHKLLAALEAGNCCRGHVGKFGKLSDAKSRGCSRHLALHCIHFVTLYAFALDVLTLCAYKHTVIIFAPKRNEVARHDAERSKPFLKSKDCTAR